MLTNRISFFVFIFVLCSISSIIQYLLCFRNLILSLKCKIHLCWTATVNWTDESAHANNRVWKIVTDFVNKNWWFIRWVNLIFKGIDTYSNHDVNGFEFHQLKLRALLVPFTCGTSSNRSTVMRKRYILDSDARSFIQLSHFEMVDAALRRKSMKISIIQIINFVHII